MVLLPEKQTRGFLREGDKIIVQDDAKSDYFGKGTLYMTNTRIVLEVMTGGLLSKTPEIKIDQPMSTIKEVSVPQEKPCRFSLRAVWSQ